MKVGIQIEPPRFLQKYTRAKLGVGANKEACASTHYEGTEDTNP